MSSEVNDFVSIRRKYLIRGIVNLYKEIEIVTSSPHRGRSELEGYVLLKFLVSESNFRPVQKAMISGLLVNNQ